MTVYNSLSKELQEKIIKNNNLSENPEAIRRNSKKDIANLWRPAYVRDTEKILHCPYYNRYADKTQVFSFYKNDDISRRGLHVQIVSRIARNIGKLLGLNLDLIEAISIGHDIGHAPFGHVGEYILDSLLFADSGLHFAHNVQSVRVLDKLFKYNISLQTLDGILSHNGEFELSKYSPVPLENFSEFDKKYDKCLFDKDASNTLIPSTLEGCVVRISDIIAYLGKDRQDAVKTHIIESDNIFENSVIGSFNAAIINNLVVNIVENSYGKEHIQMDEKYFNALKDAKRDNYSYIYQSDAVSKKVTKTVTPMFEKVYKKLVTDYNNHDESSVIYKHHIYFLKNANRFYENYSYEDETNKYQIAADFIASMTDDYFTDLYGYFFPKAKTIDYVSYFEDLK